MRTVSDRAWGDLGDRCCGNDRVPQSGKEQKENDPWLFAHCHGAGAGGCCQHDMSRAHVRVDQSDDGKRTGEPEDNR